MKLPCCKLSLWLIACLFALTPSVRAVVVNLDFNGATSGTNGVTYAGQGALATADAHFWNGVLVTNGASSSTGTLTASDGVTLTDISVTLSGGVNQFNYVNFPLYRTGNTLIDDIAYNNGYASGGKLTFTINGLTAGGQYDLYLYGSGGNVTYTANTSYFEIGGVQKFLTGHSGAFWTEGNEYVLFSGVIANGSGSITGTRGATSNAVTSPFSGLQIASVPEPSAILLILVAGSVLVMRRRSQRVAL